MLRWVQLAMFPAALACTPDPGFDDPCFGSVVGVSFAKSDDMVLGFTAVNDETRLACRQIDDVRIECPMPGDDLEACQPVADAVAARLAREDIAGAEVECFEDLNCTALNGPSGELR